MWIKKETGSRLPRKYKMDILYFLERIKITIYIVILICDHVNILFVELYENFIKEREDIPKEFDNTESNTKCFKEEDKKFKEDWELIWRIIIKKKRH